MILPFVLLVAVFAADDTFETLRDEMAEIPDGCDCERLYEFDCANYQKEADAKAAAN